MDGKVTPFPYPMEPQLSLIPGILLYSSYQHIVLWNHPRQYNFDDGRLAKAVQMKGNTVFKPKEFGLIPVHVDTFGPWVFVNLGTSKTGS